MSNIIVIMPPEYKQYLYTDLPQEVTLIGYKEMEMNGIGLDNLFETMRDRGYEMPEDTWAIDELKVVNDEYIYLKFK
jgi:hypothetical protein